MKLNTKKVAAEVGATAILVGFLAMSANFSSAASEAKTLDAVRDRLINTQDNKEINTISEVLETHYYASLTNKVLEELGQVEKSGDSVETLQPATGQGVSQVINQVVSRAVSQNADQELDATEKSKKSKWANRAVANVEQTLNIRKEKNDNSEIIGKIERAGVVKVLESGKKWTKISSNGIKGYVSTEFILTGEKARKFFKKEGAMEATVLASKLNVRSKNHSSAEVVTTLPKESTISVVESGDDWIQVEYANKKTGYVSAEYVAIDYPDAKTLKEIEEEKKRAAGYNADSDTLKLMAAIIFCEAGNQPYNGQTAVGAVIMNRVRDSRFPNTIKGVVYQKNQFTPASSGSLARALSNGNWKYCLSAAKDVLYNGANPIGNRLSFRAGRGSGLVIGNQRFF